MHVQTADPRESSHVGEDAIHRSLLARLEELRWVLLRSLLSLAAAFVVCFSFSRELFDFLMAPLEGALPPGAALIATRIPEVFILQIKMSVFAAIFLAAPIWLAFVAGFVASTLGGRLRSAFAVLVLLGTSLFVLGTAFGHYILFPYGARFLTGFGSESVHVLLSVEEVFSFYSRFVLGLGLVFQIPTLVLVLSMLRLVTPRFLLRHLREVIVVIFVVAAVVTPTPDMITQVLLALPMLGLYLLSILLSWLVQRRGTQVA